MLTCYLIDFLNLSTKMDDENNDDIYNKDKIKDCQIYLPEI